MAKFFSVCASSSFGRHDGRMPGAYENKIKKFVTSSASEVVTGRGLQRKTDWK
jgi:hypothetical protein